MNCPFCNKKLTAAKLRDNDNCAWQSLFWCSNGDCVGASGMLGTPDMWKKIISLRKIRETTNRYAAKYREKNRNKIRDYQRAWYHKHKNKEQE